MDVHIKDALIKSINIIVQDADITQLSQLRQNTSILLQLLRMIEPESKVTFTSNEENIKSTCNVINRYFEDVVDYDEIILGCELEMGKLTCLLINLTLTCQDGELAKKAVENIQKLPHDIQMYIMKMVKVVCDRNDYTNLGKILRNTLTRNSESDESPSHISPLAVHDGSYLYGSPLKNIQSPRPSPLGRYFDSAQYLYKKVMIENTKLRKSIQSNYDEKIEIAESRIEDLIDSNLKAEKEKEGQFQKNHDLQNTILKLTKDIEYLTNEVGDKGRVISDYLKEIKQLNLEIEDMQSNIQKEKDKLQQLEEKKLLIDEEQEKSQILLGNYEDLDGQYSILKEEYLKVKETRDHMSFEIEKVKSDHRDYVSHLKEEIVKLEKQCVQSGESHENMAEAMRTDAEITNLKSEIKRLKEEMHTAEKRFTEKNKSHQKQTMQYMDQITVLLKQIEEHTLRNEGLNGKINNTEMKCKLLEKQIEKCEKDAKQIQEDIDESNVEMKQKDKKITDLLGQLEAEKVKHTDEKLSMQNDFEGTFKEEQQSYEKKENVHKKILEEMKLQFANEKGQSKQKIDDFEELVVKLQDENKASRQEISKIDNERNQTRMELDSSRSITNEVKETLAKITLDNEKIQGDAAGQIEILKGEQRLKTDDYEARVEKGNKESEILQNKSTILEKELSSLKTIKEEETNSFKKQNMQYMDQISVLLNQMNEHSSRNDTLSSKNITLEGRCKQMEMETEINTKKHVEEMLSKSKEIERHTSLLVEMESEKSSLSEQNRLQEENNDKLQKEKQLLVEEQEKLNRQITQIMSEMEKIKTLIGQKDMLIETYSEENKDISEDAERKDDIIQELEKRLAEERFHSHQAAETTKSLDVQLQNAHTVIEKLKKKIAQWEENVEIPQNSFSEECFQQTFSVEDSRRQTYAVVDTRRQTFAVQTPFVNPVDDDNFDRNNISIQPRKPHEPMETILQSPDDEHEPLSIADLNPTKADSQEEPANKLERRDKRSVLSLPNMQEEENEISDPIDNPLTRTYSLREKRNKRQSFQTSRYMSGCTPPDRRTSMGEPGLLQIASFATETEDEPEVLDNMGWSMISHIKEMSSTAKDNLCDDEKSRLSELQRRNTLCLPHLRSAYPMELTVSEEGEEVAEKTIREGVKTRTSKRKCEETISTPTFKKLKRDDTQTKKEFMTDSRKSISSLRSTSSQGSNIETNPGEEPFKSSVSFDISFEPATGVKPKITRSQASANLLKSKATSTSSMEVTSKNVKRKPVAQMASSTSRLVKPLAKNVKTEGNRRLTQTLKKPSKELNKFNNNTSKSVVKLSKQTTKTTTVANKAEKSATVANKAEKSATVSNKAGKTTALSNKAEKTTALSNKAEKTTALANKAESNKFSRGDTKRSSFSRAKTRVAASLRGKK